MSIDRAASLAGLDLERDVPVAGAPNPKTGNRRQASQRQVAKLIGELRKLEAGYNADRLADHRRYEELSEKFQRATAALVLAETENRALKLRQRLAELNLTEKDQKFLLEGPSAVAIVA